MELRADGGPTKNVWLMQRQADILRDPVRVSALAELSAAGAAFLSGNIHPITNTSIKNRFGPINFWVLDICRRDINNKSFIKSNPQLFGAKQKDFIPIDSIIL